MIQANQGFFTKRRQKIFELVARPGRGDTLAGHSTVEVALSSLLDLLVAVVTPHLISPVGAVGVAVADVVLSRL